MADTEASTSSAPAVPIFKKKGKKGGAAARTAVPVDDGAGPSASSSSSARLGGADDGGSSAVVRGKKRAEHNPLRQGTSNAKRRRTDGGAEESDEDELGYSAVAVQYDTRTKARAGSPSEPRVLEGDDALARVGEEGAEALDGLYHGASKYAAQLPTGSARYGPIKAPQADVRMITLVDYQPDVCKDYKETGWCGFGDSCKFLHDRGDYKAGWQLDSILSNPASGAPAASGANDEEEELPFACLICREPFTDPVVTKCGHYFCSACALKRYRKNSKCFACGSATGGLFNKATRILGRKEKAQKERIRKREAEEGGKTDYDEGDGIEIEGLGEDGA